MDLHGAMVTKTVDATGKIKNRLEKQLRIRINVGDTRQIVRLP